MQVLESYLEECLKLVKQIEIRDAKKSSDEESEEQPKKE
jgi:hypothetical protein